MLRMSINGLKDTIDWYNSNAEQYAKAGASYFDMHHITDFTNKLPEGASVLDAGCGPGRDAHILAGQGLKVTGLDLSAGLLKVAKQKYPDIDFIEGDLLSLPFDDRSFDGVWSNTSLLHLETVEDVKQALSEMSRVLKTPGTLHVVVKSQTGADKTAVVTDKLSGHDRFFQYFSLDEMTNLLEGAGFTILQSKEYSEVETIPHGRPEVHLIWCLARKSQPHLRQAIPHTVPPN
ncbi:MAG TPA: class I SAM-dependent methyltransferase [Patescibacteria group bacterium]|jgi:ubiquinone/menaquinone biosynthesis C-methylase UbiE|nr:class I SAM-dependent methyltransferase [Patescibacteria group bacterium]